MFYLLLSYTFNADISRNQLCLKWLHVHMIGVYGYGYIHGYPGKICGLWIEIWV